MDYLNYNMVLYKKSGNLIKLLYLSFFVLLWQNTIKAQTYKDIVEIETSIGNIDIAEGKLSLDWHLVNDLIAYDFYVKGSISLNNLTPQQRASIIKSDERFAELKPTTNHGRLTLLAHPFSKGLGGLNINGNTVSTVAPVGALSGNIPSLIFEVFGQSFNGRIKDWYKDRFPNSPSIVTRNFYDNVIIPTYLRANYVFKFSFRTYQYYTPKALGKNEIKINAKANVNDYYYDGNIPFQEYTYNFVDDQYGIISSFDSQRSDLTFGTANFPGLSTIQANLPGGGYELFTFNNNNFSGVDFTNLQVSGLDVDKATGMVNFILKGNQVTGNGANLSAEESFNKKLFLQALTVPTAEWFVSLDTNPSPTASATEAFKQTDMADLFFKADVDLKKDMFTFFYNGQGDIPVITKWFQILAANNTNLLKNLINRGVNVVPNLTIRGVIVPQLANNDQLTGKMNIDNSFYNVNITFPNASINTGVVALSAEEAAFLNGANWTAFVNWLNMRRDQVSTVLRDRINGSVLPNYKKLKDILPVLVAAKWYKDAPASIIPNKQFSYLINRKLTGTTAPGLDLTQSVSWNQTYWNGQANQLLGSITVNMPNVISGVFDITGGVDLFGVNLANATMNSTKEARNSAVVSSNFINQNGSYVNGGSQRINLPNLVADNIYIDPSTNPNIPIRTFAVGENVTFNFEIKNLGLANSTGSFKLQIRNTNLVSGVTGFTNYTFNQTIGANTSLELSVPFSELPASKFRLVVDLDPDFQITESNELDNNIAVEYIVLQNQDCSAGGTVNNANFNAPTINIADCKVTLGGQINITGNGNVTALHNGVFLKDGFKHVANATSNLKIKSVFAFSNPNSNLFKGSEINASTKQPDLVVKSKGDKLKNELRIEASESKNEMITASALAQENRNYLQKSEYYSIYTITTEPQIQEVTEDPIPNDIIALRNIKDNIETLKINYTDAKVNTTEFWVVTPNPAKEYFEISFNTVTDEIASAKLFDLNGKEVMNLFTSFKINKGITKKEVNVASLPKGIYLINLETNSNVHASKLIIKQ
jgi:hypothetical protein